MKTQSVQWDVHINPEVLHQGNGGGQKIEYISTQSSFNE